eukprot:TRINITY_DN738_c0_g1_i1.p1 TRINITY_DN738_c0_g1~~TRINITY_DN738_c0_g1_i1.p1  ORF type:complete len:562 (+),score=110.10 TRINITY_DN738_c0_g1_i1:1693-3378(+)
MSILIRIIATVWRFFFHELGCLVRLVLPRKKKVVDLPCGSVKAEVNGDTLVLKGIPYAQPFTGQYRWKSPRKLPKWEGVKDCLRFSDCCPQAVNASCSKFTSTTAIAFEAFFRMAMLKLRPNTWLYQGSEDSLCLNVWCNAQKLDGKAPVMVFVHGGAFLVGSGGPPIYDGDAKVKNGVILVTLNYRLGVLGNLRVPGGDNNRGLRDVLAALEWVQENIASLGGDPTNVTLFGESAGAMTVANIMSSPLRKKEGVPMFRRAICMSGASHNVLSKEKSDLIYRRFLSFLPEGTSVEDLSTTPYELLQKAQSCLVRGHFKEYRELLQDETMILVPHMDGNVLVEHPLRSISKGTAKDIELVLGTNLHEYTLFMAPHRKENFNQDVPKRIETWLRQHGCGERSITISDAYERSKYAETFAGYDGHKMYNAVATDWVFRLPAHRMAEAHCEGGGKAHVYRYDRVLPFVSFGATHGSELPLLFGMHHGLSPLVGACSVADNSARLLQETWTSIAKDGVSAEEWPHYDHRKQVMSLCGGDGSIKEVLTAPHDDALESWGDIRHFKQY